MPFVSTLLVLLAVLVPVLAGFVLLLRVVGGRASARGRALAAELAAEPARLGPDPAVHRGGMGAHPRPLGTGLLAVTGRRLLFRTVSGQALDVVLVEVTGAEVREAPPRGTAAPERYLLVQTARGDLGFELPDPERWRDAVLGADGSAEG